MFYKELTEKDQEICHLKDHSQKLLAQIKKAKVMKQYNKKLEQEKVSEGIQEAPIRKRGRKFSLKEP
jgi:hypothetical protein